MAVITWGDRTLLALPNPLKSVSGSRFRRAEQRYPTYGGRKQITVDSSIEKSSIVRACLHLITNAVSSGELKLYRVGTETEVERPEIQVPPDTINGLIRSAVMAGDGVAGIVTEPDGTITLEYMHYNRLWISNSGTIGRDKKYNYGWWESRIELTSRDVVHFTWADDPREPGRGEKVLESVMGEIKTDALANAFVENVLENGDYPGAIIMPEGEDILETTEQKALMEQLNTTSKDNQGKTVVFKRKMIVNPLAAPRQKLDLGMVRAYPETRICGVLGVSPVLIGTLSGLQHTHTNATAREVRYDFGQIQIKPLQQRLARVLNKQFLPRLQGVEGLEYRYDNSESAWFENPDTPDPQSELDPEAGRGNR